MADDWIESARERCQEAADLIDGHGSQRLRVAIQIVLIELERERSLSEAEQANDDSDH